MYPGITNLEEQKWPGWVYPGWLYPGGFHPGSTHPGITNLETIYCYQGGYTQGGSTLVLLI